LGFLVFLDFIMSYMIAEKVINIGSKLCMVVVDIKIIIFLHIFESLSINKGDNIPGILVITEMTSGSSWKTPNAHFLLETALNVLARNGNS